jgi:hypothetical protein
MAKGFERSVSGYAVGPRQEILGNRAETFLRHLEAVERV